jgi:hypothetical protein
MSFTQTITHLHADNLSNVIRSINNSIYSADFPYDKDNTFIIHTGVSFEMQNGKLIELYYDFVNRCLIRQSVFWNHPQILGLVYHFWNTYIKVWDKQIVISVNEKEGTCNLIEFNNETDLQNRTEFEIVEPLTSKVLILNPLTRVLNETLFFNGDIFYSDNADSEDYSSSSEDSSYENDNINNSWICDACGGDSNTGCLSSTGDCYR